MKTSNFKYLIGVILASMLFAGCSDDFFSHPPTGQIVQDTFYETEEDLAMATGALYNIGWFDFNDKVIVEIGDAGAASIHHTVEFYDFNANAASPRLNETWRSLYIIVNQVNTHLQNIQNASSPNIHEAVLNHRMAEARFMRAVAYLYLVRLWGPVPIIERTQDLVNDPLVYRHREEDVFQFILNELEFARDNLILDEPDGRVTEWAAKSYLAKTHLTLAYYQSQGGQLVQSHLDAARSYAEEVINNSPHQLMPDYVELFKRENNNNPESIFALQWVVGSGTWGAQNTQQAYYAPDPGLTGVGDGWGAAHGISAWAFELFGGASTDDARRKPTYMAYGDHYPELRTAFGGYTHEGTRPNLKKYIIGRPEDNDGMVEFMGTDINTYMMRLAEVYLIAAEAILGNNESTTNPTALQYFNAVRERAGVEPLAEIDFMTILEERVREFTVEGVVYYDILRLWKKDPQAAVDLIHSQHREMRPNWNSELGEYEIIQDGAAPTVTPNSFIMPYPEADMSANPNLREDPIPYEFN